MQLTRSALVTEAAALAADLGVSPTLRTSVTHGLVEKITPRPREVVLASVLMCVFNLAGVLFYQPLEGISAVASLAVFAVLYSVVAAASFLVIWFFWMGRNWARWLVLATSVLALLNVLSFGSAGHVARALLVAEALLGAWLLFWLNTARAREFFGGARRASAETAG